MKIHILMLGVSCFLLLGGCKKGGEAAKKGSTAACPATAWKEPSGLFCIDAKGFTPGELKKNENVSAEDPTMEIYFKREAAGDKPEVMFHVSWYPKRGNIGAVGEAAQLDLDYKNNTGEDKGTFAGGNGRYVVWARKDEPKSHKLYSFAKGNQHVYDCEASNFGAPIDPEVIAACKTLLPTD